MKEQITPKQAASALFIAVAADSLVGGGAASRVPGGWAALLAGGAAVCLLLICCAAPMELSEAENLPEFFRRRFGRGLGGVLCALAAAVALLHGAATIGLFTEFVTATSFMKTARLFVAAAIVAVAGGAALCRMARVGRVAQLAFPVVVCLAVLSVVLSAGYFSAGEWLPQEGVATLLPQSAGAAAELVTPMFLTLFAVSLAKRAAPGSGGRKLWKRSLVYFIAAVVVIAVLAMRNVAVLGSGTAFRMYFPAYAASGILEAGEFVQRAEAVMAAAFLGASVLRLAVCLSAAGGGLAGALGGSVRKWTAVACVAAWTIAVVSFGGMIEYVQFAKMSITWCWPVAAGLSLAAGAGALFTRWKEKKDKAAAT